jgi:DNA repair photolyase
LQLTRQILQVLLKCNHPLRIVTKSALIERDIDLLSEMATRRLLSVSISVTGLDRDLSRRMEPRASAPQRRLKTIERLSSAGIPVRLLLAPLIPALNDGQIESILEHGHAAGACAAGYVMLRLPLEIRDLFVEWLHEHYPLRAEHIMARIRDVRDGKDYDAQFGKRMSGTGIFAELIAKRFALCASRLGLLDHEPALECSSFRAPELAGQQLSLL